MIRLWLINTMRGHNLTSELCLDLLLWHLFILCIQKQIFNILSRDIFKYFFIIFIDFLTIKLLLIPWSYCCIILKWEYCRKAVVALMQCSRIRGLGHSSILLNVDKYKKTVSEWWNFVVYRRKDVFYNKENVIFFIFTNLPFE